MYHRIGTQKCTIAAIENAKGISYGVGDLVFVPSLRDVANWKA